MNAPPNDDWRLTNQEAFLADALLVRKPYRVYSEEWEHDHCAFCWAKFMDPTFSKEHRRAIQADSTILVEGYTTTDAHPAGADYHWICPQCFDDFKERFRFRLSSAV